MADKDAHRKAIKKDRLELLPPRSLLCMLCLVVHLRLMLLKLLTDAAALLKAVLAQQLSGEGSVFDYLAARCLLPNPKPF